MEGAAHAKAEGEGVRGQFLRFVTVATGMTTTNICTVLVTCQVLF